MDKYNEDENARDDLMSSLMKEAQERAVVKFNSTFAHTPFLLRAIQILCENDLVSEEMLDLTDLEKASLIDDLNYFRECYDEEKALEQEQNIGEENESI